MWALSSPHPRGAGQGHPHGGIQQCVLKKWSPCSYMVAMAGSQERALGGGRYGCHNAHAGRGRGNSMREMCSGA